MEPDDSIMEAIHAAMRADEDGWEDLVVATDVLMARGTPFTWDDVERAADPIRHTRY